MLKLDKYLLNGVSFKTRLDTFVTLPGSSKKYNQIKHYNYLISNNVPL